MKLLPRAMHICIICACDDREWYAWYVWMKGVCGMVSVFLNRKPFFLYIWARGCHLCIGMHAECCATCLCNSVYRNSILFLMYIWEWAMCFGGMNGRKIIVCIFGLGVQCVCLDVAWLLSMLKCEALFVEIVVRMWILAFMNARFARVRLILVYTYYTTQRILREVADTISTYIFSTVEVL